MGLLIKLLVSALAVFLTSQILPGVKIDSFTTALLVAAVLGIVNALIKPILTIITLPLTILTLGLFSFILNGLLILLVSSLVHGFVVENFLWAVIFGIVMAIVSSLLHGIIK